MKKALTTMLLLASLSTVSCFRETEYEKNHFIGVNPTNKSVSIKLDNSYLFKEGYHAVFEAIQSLYSDIYDEKSTPNIEFYIGNHTNVLDVWYTLPEDLKAEGVYQNLTLIANTFANDGGLVKLAYVNQQGQEVYSMKFDLDPKN
jgi:hypothetical protein